LQSCDIGESLDVGNTEVRVIFFIRLYDLKGEKMLLEEEYIEVIVNSRTVKYYESLGYEIPKRKNKQNKEVFDKGAFFKVKVKHLPKQSNKKVPVECDYCGTVFFQSLDNRYKYYGKNNIEKDCCQDCCHEKYKESVMLKYGVDNTTKLKEVQEKIRNTLIEKYDVDCSLKIDIAQQKTKETLIEKYGTTDYWNTEEVKEKTRKTNLERYGVENPLSNKEVREKCKRTTLERYGVDNVNKSKEIRKKIEKTNLERYGFTTCLLNDEVRKKSMESYHKHNSARFSKQQAYICNLLKGSLNYPVGSFFLDIALLDEKIYIEYDGGGHDLCVKLKKMTREDFEIREKRRYDLLKSEGWKMIRIISEKDYVFEEEDLYRFLEKSKKELAISNIYHVKIDLEHDDHNYNLKRI
jgi:very-short-patch-repair endonuclease